MKLYEVTDINGGVRTTTWVNPSEIQMVAPSWAYSKPEPPYETVDAVYVTLRRGGVKISPEDWETLKAAAGIEIVKP